MKNKKDIKVINVTNPQVGKVYEFLHAGSSRRGVLLELNKNLTDHYNHNWYKFEVKTPIEHMQLGGNRTIWRYSASIFNIIKEIK